MKRRSLLLGVLVLVVLTLLVSTAFLFSPVASHAQGVSVSVTSHGGINNNPWGYDFNKGKLITNPPAAFCSYFPCILNFSKGRGYVVECKDAKYSKSGGIQGVCSGHKGYWRTLYAH